MNAPFTELPVERRRRDARFQLLMAIDHLCEGSQLYESARREADASGQSALAEFFAALERASRHQVALAKDLLNELGGKSR